MYIEREALIAEFKRLTLGENSLVERLFADGVYAVIESFPAADVAPVVRCKDCKHYHEKEGWCDEHSHFIGSQGEACHPWESNDWKMFEPDDFCSYGERRTNNVQET